MQMFHYSNIQLFQRYFLLVIAISDRYRVRLACRGIEKEIKIEN